MKYLIFALLTIQTFITNAQTPKVPENVYGIKNPVSDGGKNCSTCLANLEMMPADVKFGFFIDGNEIYFMLTDVRWFDKLFSKGSDGIAVDIVSKSQFSCSLKQNKLANSWAYRGYLLPPVYLKQMKSSGVFTETGEFVINMGIIPEHLRGDDLELNMLLISNKYLCRYNTFFDVPQQKWSLLEMGLYMDTLKQEVVNGKTKEIKDKYVMFSRKMKFEIPFEKNKSEYSQEDIKPLYDSLRLNTYDIKSISIRAYSSVEGSTERNIELQEKRAESIVKVLQSFQMDTIQKDIHASENWVEFLEDITDTKFNYLKSLSKEEIKKKLENKQLSAEMESIFKKHRKAILLIELEKKSRFPDNDTNKIKAAFEKAIVEKNIGEAMEIQQIIFSKIRNNKIPSLFLENLEIPQTYEFGMLLNNYAVFNYDHNEADVVSSIGQFEKLLLLMPNNKNIMYNIVALKIKSWVYGQLIANTDELKNDIIALEKKGIDKRLIRRMMINYYIIYSEYLFLQKKYAEKDQAIKYIFNNYSTLNLNEKDALNLAQYFAGYSKYQWAEAILNKYVTKVDVSEDLLFYYINLTIVKPNITENKNYRATMLNAININKDRFCKIFDPFGKGGITFQLLESEYLRKTYCESCNH